MIGNSRLSKFILIVAVMFTVGILCFLNIRSMTVYSPETERERVPRPDSASHVQAAPLAQKVSQKAINAEARVLASERRTSSNAFPAEFKTQFHAWLNQVLPNGFILTDHEFDVLTNSLVNILRISGEVKAESARVVHQPNGTIEISVPARYDTAVVLWESFHADLVQQLTAKRADEIDDVIGENLGQSYLRGVGIADEKYTFTPRADGQYDFSYDARTTGPLKGSLRLISRRFAGGGESGRRTLAEVFEQPQYSFLKKYF